MNVVNEGYVRNREIRIFISSTFKDMKEEREELVKRVFPQLRRLCEIRGVTLREVDLRWGITDEQGADGQVLPICLSEIDSCRPYFIGILGEHYGWIPREVSDELIEKESWLDNNRDKSVTELEILHGALNDPELAGYTFFYFRDKAYVDSRPASEREFLLDAPTKDEIGKSGFEEATRQAEERRRNLSDLKKRIRESGLTLRENYADPVELGELVLKDLTELIDRLFPEEETPDQLDKEASEHYIYAESRFRIYIGRQENFDLLDEFVVGDGPPLVITGVSGIGKSALLANWSIKYRQEHPETPVLIHFIGALPFNADWSLMLRRIMGELQRMFDIQGDIPSDVRKLKSSFASWLHMAATKGRVVIILDALNQLEDRDNALDLSWLPPFIPGNIRLIVSTLPGEPLDVLKKRGWPVLKVEPLTDDERERLISEYLGQHRKSLDKERIRRIASAEQTRNPLYLRILLEELRMFGIHKNLDRAIEHYLSSDDIPSLYGKILKRMEQDYDRDWPGLVQDTMTYIWASRRGLLAVELLDLLGAAGKPLPQAQWAQFYSAVEKLFINRSGLTGFAHEYIRKAITQRYLPSRKAQQNSHLKLADYFAPREIGPRVIDELPWQLSEADEWRRLYDLLSDLDFFGLAWKNNEFEVKRYWSKIDNNPELSLVEAYRPLIDSFDEIPTKETLMQVSDLLLDTGHLAESAELKQALLNHCRNSDDVTQHAECVRGLAEVMWKTGNVKRAMELYQEHKKICEKIGDIQGQQLSLGSLAIINYRSGKLDEAIEMLTHQEQTCREINYLPGLMRCLNSRALVLSARGDVDQAMTLHKEVERYCRELGNPEALATNLGNQAIILWQRGELEKGMELYKEQERICRELGEPYGIQRSLGHQALVLRDLENLDGAVKLLKEQEQICRDLGHMDGLQVSLGNQAEILIRRDELEKAMALCIEGEAICRENKYPDGLAYCLAHMADIVSKQGDKEKAILLAEEALRLVQEHGFKWLAEIIKPKLDAILSGKSLRQ